MRQQIEQTIAEVAKRLYEFAGSIELTRPDDQFGDYATNVALQLAKSAGKNPREVAEAIAAELRDKLSMHASEVSVAGPGFINIRLNDQALRQLAERNIEQVFAGRKILAEYSDPNPFKPLHAGHLYTTLVGDIISRLAEAAGAETIRLNYGGDVGLHVGKSMWAIVRHLGGELPEKLAEVSEAERPAWMGARYVEGNNAYERNEAARAEIIEINRQVYTLHQENDHQSPFAQIYWTCRQWSYDYFAILYRQLQIKPFDRFIPESEVTSLGLRTVQEQLAKGVYQKSGNAVIFDGEKYGLHTRVFINSEGIPTYETKDVGLSLTKWYDYHFDESIIITANEQQQYMQVVIASIAQFAPEPAERTKHLVHGVVKLQGGVKMSSRKGNVVTALDILEAARQAAAETGTGSSEETVLAAVKYAFAKNRIGSDIAYDPKESIALEGNSGPYLQYAHARAQSIIRKAAQHRSDILPKDIALQADERRFLRQIAEYSEAVDRAVSDLMPHHICIYLYELAQVFNRFYESNLVVGDERQSIRLDLIERYADRLKTGLELLGISAPDRM